MSCKFECDGFPESELVWIPYRINDTLSYSNGDDTITFIVDDYDPAEPDKFRALAEEVICYNIAFYYASESSHGYVLRELCDYQLNIDIEIIRYDWFRWNLESREPRSPGIQVKYLKTQQ